MSIMDRSESRAGAAVIWAALHTTEGNGTARELRDAGWWTGSAHAISDMTELLTDGMIPVSRAAWTLRNGNHRSVNLEQIGWAKWDREFWLSERMPQLRFAAQWLQDMHTELGIPLRLLSLAECAKNLPGVIQHTTYTQAFHDGEHWDCGPGYPDDVVIDLANGPSIKEDSMTPDQDQRLKDALASAQNAAIISSDVRNWITDPHTGILHQLEGLSGQLAALQANAAPALH